MNDDKENNSWDHSRGEEQEAQNEKRTTKTQWSPLSFSPLCESVQQQQGSVLFKASQRWQCVEILKTS